MILLCMHFYCFANNNVNLTHGMAMNHVIKVTKFEALYAVCEHAGDHAVANKNVHIKIYHFYCLSAMQCSSRVAVDKIYYAFEQC